jgi:hypothetical protein
LARKACQGQTLVNYDRKKFYDIGPGCGIGPTLPQIFFFFFLCSILLSNGQTEKGIKKKQTKVILGAEILQTIYELLARKEFLSRINQV